MKRPLEGIVVLDLSRILAGPYCTMMLADLGADVIKVERPGQGDDTRTWGPPFVGGESAYFLSVNRNKRSVTIDLKSSEGRALIERLAERADVMVQNFRPGVAEKLGIGYADLAARNSRLVYCALSSFGQSGPYAQRAGYDALIQAMGGLMSITGQPDGPPTKLGVAIVDVVAGLFSLAGILAALHEREKTGEGQLVDVSLFDSVAAALVNQAQSYLVTGKVPSRMGNAHPSIVPYQPFRASDEWFMVAIGNDGLFGKLCEAIGRPALADDPRFLDNARRVDNRAVLIPLLEERFAESSASDWVYRCLKAGVPAGPINGIDAVMRDPQLQHRGMIAKVEHPTAGALELVANPIHLSRTPATVERPPPLLGQHTEEVLGGLLQLDAAALGELSAKGVI